MKTRSLAVTWGYLGAVIGAGFASGQEIVQFFVGYGPIGLKGTFITAGLLALLGAILFAWGAGRIQPNYQSLLTALFGRRFAVIMDVLLSLSLLLGICTMFSASGAVFYEHLYMPRNLGIFLAYSGVMAVLFGGYRGLVSAYNILVPIKVLLLLSVAVLAALHGHESSLSADCSGYQASAGGYRWFCASVIYVGYNFALALVVLAEYFRVVSRREGICGAAVGGAAAGGLAIISYLALSAYQPDVMHYQVPMLFVAGHVSGSAKAIYLVVLWLGIMTTAIANTYGFAQRLSQVSRLGYRPCLFLAATMALPLSFQGFSTLVGTFYPAFGVLGVLIMAMLLIRYFSDSLASLRGQN